MTTSSPQNVYDVDRKYNAIRTNSIRPLATRTSKFQHYYHAGGRHHEACKGRSKERVSS